MSRNGWRFRRRGKSEVKKIMKACGEVSDEWEGRKLKNGRGRKD